MTPSILLLDCSSKLTERLKRQGFNADSGTIGFCNRTRHLPCQVYEKDIFIYNPSFFASNAHGYIESDDIQDITPDYSLSYLKEHILRGAKFLIFINRIAEDLDKQNEAYNWIPFMPKICFTKDHQPITINVADDLYYNHLAPLALQQALKIPVLQKIISPRAAQFTHPPDVFKLFLNKNYEVLGVFLKRGEGELIILPEYKDNEEIISIFLNRIMPKMYKLEMGTNIIDQFLSPEEKTAYKEIQKTESAIQKDNEILEAAKERLAGANRNKIQIIKNDETAVLILNYYDLSAQQEDVALFYLYKIIEALEKKYGSEKEAKSKLGCNTEWNLIGRLANMSYADIRHAPKPGEKVKEWTQEEIKSCFTAAKKIVYTYFSTLF